MTVKWWNWVEFNFFRARKVYTYHLLFGNFFYKVVFCATQNTCQCEPWEEVLNHVPLLFIARCIRHFFKREASSESNCNRSFQGRPSGWNWLMWCDVYIYMCSSLKGGKWIQRAIPQYPLLYGSLFYIFRFIGITF